MDQATLNSILLKLNNGDLDGAAVDMQAHAVLLAGNGHAALSDFLARHAFRTLRDKHDPTKTLPLLNKALQQAEQHQARLDNEYKALLDDLYAYFQAFEQIAYAVAPEWTQPVVFNEQNRDNLPFIEDFLNQRESPIDALNLQGVLRKQIKFYLNLNLADERPGLKVTYRKTHILQGKSWRFVELSLQAAEKTEKVNRLPSLENELYAVHREVTRLKEELRETEQFGHRHAVQFQEKLGAFLGGVAAPA